MAKKSLSVLLSILLVFTTLPLVTLPALAGDAPEPVPAAAQAPALPEEPPAEPAAPAIPDPLGLLDHTFAAPKPKKSPKRSTNAGDIDWSFDETTGVLTFTGSGAMPDYVMDMTAPLLPETPWSDLCDKAETIVIGENITHIGSCAFTAFEALTEVVLPSSLTSIGDYAFAYCMELTTVELPAGLTEIGEGAFAVNKLSGITIPAGVTEIHQLFIMNMAPLSVTLNEGLETIDQCFDYCVIPSLTIPSTVTSFTGYVDSEGTETLPRILNTQTFVNNSAVAAVSDCLAHVNPETLSDFFLMVSFEYRVNMIYLRTGEEPEEEDIYPLYLDIYNTILGTDYTDFEALMAILDSDDIPEEYLSRLNAFEMAADTIEAPLPTISIYCLSESAEHEALRTNGYPHYLIDQNNQLCEEPVSAQCGDHLTWTIENGALVITGYGAMYDNYNAWLFSRDQVDTVTFTEQGGAITSIGENAFRYFGTLDTVCLPAGVTYFGSNWLSNCTVGTLSLPADFAYWDEYPNATAFCSDARSVNGYSVAAGNPVYSVYNGSLYGTHNGQTYLLRYTGSGEIKDGTEVIERYAYYNNKTITSFTVPASVSVIKEYAFENCSSLASVQILPADHTLRLSLACFNYCSALSSFAVDAADTRFAVQDGALFTKDMTKVVAVPYAISELTLPATVTGVWDTDGSTAYTNRAGLTKLTVMNRNFVFGYGNSIYNSAFCMARVSSNADIEIVGYTASSAEILAGKNGYTFTSLDNITIESVTFDLSNIPETVYVNESVYFYNWYLTGQITYSNGNTRTLSYNSGDFNIYYQYPNATYWQSNNWTYFGNGAGDYLFEIRYGTSVTPFTITAVEPDFSFEFDIADAITEVKQYEDRSAYESTAAHDHNILGVKLYKVYDDPDRAPELLNIHNNCNVNFDVDGGTWYWTEMMNRDVGSVFTVYFRFSQNGITAEAHIDVTVVAGDITLTVDESGLLTEVDQFPGGSLTPQSLGLAVWYTKNGQATDITSHAYFQGELSLSETGEYTADLCVSYNGLYRLLGTYTYTVVPVTYEIELTSYEAMQYTVFTYETWTPSVYKIKDGVRTQIFPDGYVYFYQHLANGSQYNSLNTDTLGVKTLTPYTYINNSYLELPDVEITVVPNTFTFELDTASFISTVEQYFPYSTYNSGLKVNKVTDGVSELYTTNVYCSGSVDNSTPGEYTVTPYFSYDDNGRYHTVYLDPVTVTVTPCTLSLEILSYTETVEQYGSYASTTWAPTYSVKRGDEPFTQSFSVYFYYLQPDGGRYSYLNTTEAGEHTIYAYIYYNGYEIDTVPLTVTVTESPATFTLDLTNVQTEIVQYGVFSLGNASVTMTRNGEATTLNSYVYMEVTDPEGNSRYNSLNAALPGVHTVRPYINYNNNRIDLEPFTVTVTASGIVFGIDTSAAELNVLQYVVGSLTLRDLGAVATKTVNGETTSLNNTIYGTVYTDYAGTFTLSPYIYYDESGGSRYCVDLPEVTVTVLSAAEYAEALTLGETSTTEGLPSGHRAVYRFTPAVSGTYTFTTTGVFSYGYAYVYDANGSYCGYKYVNGSDNVLTASLTAGVTYVYHMTCMGTAPYTVNVELGHVHRFAVLTAADPTCTQQGNVDCVYCDICEKYFTDATAEEELTEAEALIPATNHANAEHHGANSATCAAAGNIEHWYCPDCETYFSDAACTARIDGDSIGIPAINHRNAEHHGANAATCAAAGNIEYWYCPDCGTYFSDAAYTAPIDGDTVGIPAINHANAEHHGANAATCAAAGNTEYWYCPDCGTYFSDAACTSAISEAQTVIGIDTAAHNYGAWTKLNDQKHQRVCANDPNHAETADHNWNSGTVTTPPTCATKGVKTFTCNDCGATKTQEIATVGHKDDNHDGWCDYNCGTATGTTPTEPSDPGQSPEGDECPLCHERHTGFFGKIVGFFHRIIYFFKNLFRK